MGNSSLNKAKNLRDDEFYTQLKDIKDELQHYEAHFANKAIYMNADNPEQSQFWVYFKTNFERLKLKRITATYYGESSHMTTYDGVSELRTPLKGDGDFRSDECVEILKNSDIVVTNPPFSLFRELLSLLVNHGKHFIIMGNMNAVTYKDTFKLRQDGKLWPGTGFRKSLEFILPKDRPIRNGKGRIDKDGTKYIKVQGVTWFTNLDYSKRHIDLPLKATYKGSENEYPKYDNFDAINVDKVANIPKDYYGVMGVSISFIGKWNPNQFEIVGLGIGSSGLEAGAKDVQEYHKEMRKLNTSYRRGTLCYFKDGKLKVPYARILIKRK